MAKAVELLHPMRPRERDGRLVRDHRFVLRQMTATWRVAPHFLVAGAMKAGTSSLFYYLCQHPRIVGPFRKETHYFTAGHRAGKGEDWYRAHFPLRWQLGKGYLTGEATPGYMFEPDGPERIARALPDIRVIVVLRDPVARAVSHYRHEVAMGREFLPFDQAIALEEERRARAAAAGPAGHETWLHASYKARGIYLEQIRRLEAAIPRERIFVLGSALLRHRPAEAVAAVLGFLGLPMEGEYNFAQKNRSKVSDPLPEPVLAELSDFFASHNARLFDHLGFEPEW
ncbi:sulfotransferase domain-containing protein [uncultured Jannaschia sp.]|uniref:sulfotransferase domain-containing protein n=1 Tax=uncultured Jannaschia sp. TaxID=293347 RepID=UPI002623F707|nr:sulfotransferase domain-containing protein [uncultured Jannaschia sp.]